MIPYRKFSDIHWNEFGAPEAPNSPKAPKVGNEEANNARTLDGLAALAASRSEFADQSAVEFLLSPTTESLKAQW